MKIDYIHYEPDQGLEELQAKIYTESSGLPANAAQIRERLMDEKRDPKTVRYAMTDEGEPLAYVQASHSSSYPGRMYISYPWAMQNCPQEVQEHLFSDLLSYINEHKNPREVGSAVVLRSKIANKQIKFFRENGFKESERIFWYCPDLDVKEVSTREITEEISVFSSRPAIIDDLDLLIELASVDSQLSGALPTREAAVVYFRDRVLKEGRAVLVFDGEQLVAASAPLKIAPNHPIFGWTDECIIMRFSAIRPRYVHAWQRLVIEVAKECVNMELDDLPLRTPTYFRANSASAIGLAELQADLTAFEVVFVQQK